MQGEVFSERAANCLHVSIDGINHLFAEGVDGCVVGGLFTLSEQPSGQAGGVAAVGLPGLAGNDAVAAGKVELAGGAEMGCAAFAEGVYQGDDGSDGCDIGHGGSGH